MSNGKPLIPNFVPGTGKLVTTRYDFEQHITGANFRHVANQIDIFPTLIIEGNTVTNVQEAITSIVANITPPTISSATVGTNSSNLGIITLGGDLGGNALIPRVTRLQGYSVSTLPPISGNVLTWNGSSWIAVAPTTTFSTLNIIPNGFLLMGSGATLNNDGYFNFQSGSITNVLGTQNFQSGSTLNLFSGSTVDLLSGSALVAENGSSVMFSSGSSLMMKGASTYFTDNNPPKYVSPYISRNIIQPLTVFANTAATTNNGTPNFSIGNWTDQVSSSFIGMSWFIPLLKIINGATLSAINVPFTTTLAPSSGANNQRIELWKTNLNTGVTTQIGNTKTVPNGLSILTYYPNTINFTLSEVIDDSIYSYSLIILQAYGSSAYAIEWGAVQLEFTNITQVGQT